MGEDDAEVVDLSSPVACGGAPRGGHSTPVGKTRRGGAAGGGGTAGAPSAAPAASPVECIVLDGGARRPEPSARAPAASPSPGAGAAARFPSGKRGGGRDSSRA